MKSRLLKLVFVSFLAGLLLACSTPEEKAQKYYEKGMSLLETDPDKAKLEFQNALQIKKNMTSALYGLALAAERKQDWKKTFALLNSVIDQDPQHVDALIKSAQILLAGNRLDVATERANKALALNPNNPSVFNLHAAIQLKLNNPKGAIDFANKALALDPKNQDAMIVLASERMAAKDPAGTLVFLDKALSSNEKNLAVHLFRIGSLEEMGRLEEADKGFQRMLQIAPDPVPVRRSYAEFLSRHGKMAEAEVQLREIIKISSKSLEAKLALVRFVVKTQGVEKGQESLEAFVKEQPENYDLAFALVDFYRAQKNSSAEDKLLQRIINQAGNSAHGNKAKTMLAYKLLVLGKKDEANKLINDALEYDKTNAQALLLRAGQELDAKNYDAAIIDLRTVLRDAPENHAAAFMLANAHERAGSPELAEEHYLKAFQASKFAARYTLAYSEFLLRRKQPERAEKVLEEAVNANVNDTQLLRTLAQFKLQRGDQVGAQALADKAKQLNKGARVADEIEGAISLSKNDLQGSINAFKRAYEAAPNDGQAVVALVRSYMLAGKKQDALNFIDAILKKNPNQIDAWLLKGQLYASTGESSKAIQVFTDLIQHHPDNAIGYQQLAMVQQQNKDLQGAEKTLQQGLAVAPKDFGLKLTQAALYESQGKNEDAISEYENVIKIRPDSQVAINNLVSLLSDTRNDQASYKRAYELSEALKDSKIPQFLDTYGWACYKVGKLSEAEDALKEVVKLLPDMPVYQYHLAKVYIAKNDKILAKQALQKAIKAANGRTFKHQQESSELLKTL
ncbi:MAG TPA: tetratricopeptide repeat protein [Methylophilus sp.]|nr:tetratricopeptide repeat protein [Methylophilus sp.]HQQ34001.1 tetratricopeptide repeat protein [Methylophilus sp.]